MWPSVCRHHIFISIPSLPFPDHAISTAAEHRTQPCASSPLGACTGVRLLDQMVAASLASIPIMTVLIYNPINSASRFLLIHILCHLLSLVFMIIAILGVQWCLTMVLIWISLNLVMLSIFSLYLLPIHKVSFEKYLFRSLALLVIGLFVLFVCFP